MFSKNYFLIAGFFLLFITLTASAQTDRDEVASTPSVSANRARGLNMLSEIKNTIKLYYYDKNYHGINLDERFKIAAERIKKLETNAQIFRVIAQVVLEFEDSHTTFYPPNRANRVEYGFSMQMIGNDCFIIDVKRAAMRKRKV